LPNVYQPCRKKEEEARRIGQLTIDLSGLDEKSRKAILKALAERKKERRK
jgi:hypothetical protein